MRWQDLLVLVAVYAAFLFPLFLILRAWREAVTSRRMPPLHVAGLVAATISQALLLAGLLEPNVIGPEASARRSITIAVNVALTVIALVLSALIRSEWRGRLLMTSIWLTCTWLIVGLVTSAD